MRRQARRNLARVLGLALVLVSLALLGDTGSAGADDSTPTLVKQGWWWQAAALPGAPVPKPPNVSEGQLYVQGSPNGKTAYAAVQYTVGSGTIMKIFTLKVGENGDTGGDKAVVIACRITSDWKAAEGASFAEGPTFSGDGCVNGQRASDGKSWAFAVAALQNETVLDIAIGPGIDPGTKLSSTFSLVFDKPASDSLVVAPGTPTSGATFSSPTPATFGSSAAQTGAGTASSPTIPYQAPAVATATPAVSSDKVQPAPAPSQTPSAKPVAASQKDRNKTPGYIVLAFAALVGLYAYRQDNLMAMNGGSLPGAPDAPGGLGRFARPRTGVPPALT